MVKRFSIIFATIAILLAGCSTTSDYKLYAETQQKIAQAQANAHAVSEAARYSALAEIAKNGDATARVAAAMSLSMGSQNNNSPMLRQPQVNAPRNFGDTALQWTSVLLPSLTNIYGISANRQVAITQSNNQAAVATSTNNTFASMNAAGHTANQQIATQGLNTASTISGQGFTAVTNVATQGLNNASTISGQGFTAVTNVATQGLNNASTISGQGFNVATQGLNTASTISGQGFNATTNVATQGLNNASTISGQGFNATTNVANVGITGIVTTGANGLTSLTNVSKDANATITNLTNGFNTSIQTLLQPNYNAE